MSMVISDGSLSMRRLSGSTSSMCIWGYTSKWRQIHGDYEYGGKDSNGNDYWFHHMDGVGCYPQFIDTFYIRYSTKWNRYQISFKNEEDYLISNCDQTDLSSPDECTSFEMDHLGETSTINPLRIINGPCPELKSEHELSVTNSMYNPSGSSEIIAYSGCNGIFRKHDYGRGILNLYIRTELYDNEQFAWYYNYAYQRWQCHGESEDVPFTESNTIHKCDGIAVDAELRFIRPMLSLSENTITYPQTLCATSQGYNDFGYGSNSVEYTLIDSSLPEYKITGDEECTNSVTKKSCGATYYDTEINRLRSWFGSYCPDVGVKDPSKCSALFHGDRDIKFTAGQCFNECPGSDLDSNCNIKYGVLRCDTSNGYKSSCNLPLTADCDQNCVSIISSRANTAFC